MKPKRYIVWSKEGIDLSDPWRRKWYIKKVLTQGRTEDIARLDWEEVKSIITEPDIPEEIKKLWEDYFNYVERQRNNHG